MKASLHYRLDQLAIRLEELNALLASPDVANDMNQFRKLTKEHADITPLVALFKRFEQTQADEASAREMLADPDMKEFAQEELKVAAEQLEQLERELEIALLPKDQNDERNVIMEIRAGTGGDEAALFAGDLLRMYLRFAERSGWRTEVMSQSEGEVGGYKEVIFRIEGTQVYSRMKFESGGHRVQRVPATETQGRIHTSACTVAVMPEADEIEDVQINPSELRIDTFRASGAGGQHINKTDSAVRIVHIPTGITVECQDDRSQHRNRDRAMKILVTRIRDVQEREAHAKEAATRKSLIGSGDRSERIRTYNYPQGRMTDHRINLTLYKLSYIMDGDIEEMVSALVMQDQADKLADLAAQTN